MAGMELDFFIAALTVLCFRLVTKAVLIRHLGCSCRWTVLAQRQGPLCCSLCQ